MLHMDPCIDRDKLLEFITTTWDPIIGGFMRSADANYVAKTKRLGTDLESTLEELRLTSGSTELFTNLLDLIYGDGVDEKESHKEQASDRLPALEFVVPELNIPQSTFDRLKQLHQKWRSAETVESAS
ncbi:unnamed protein product [Dibothriocephalus latus]|uniref:Uncharacterized protein n=1 Tax=Dibothriocephalus latus TaxID=60516 RepID=A0A3P6TS02_DIBLA|nr:unnamed protein product [Dibothriocephalus latus]